MARVQVVRTRVTKSGKVVGTTKAGTEAMETNEAVAKLNKPEAAAPAMDSQVAKQQSRVAIPAVLRSSNHAEELTNISQEIAGRITEHSQGNPENVRATADSLAHVEAADAAIERHHASYGQPYPTADKESMYHLATAAGHLSDALASLPPSVRSDKFATNGLPWMDKSDPESVSLEAARSKVGTAGPVVRAYQAHLAGKGSDVKIPSDDQGSRYFDVKDRAQDIINKAGTLSKASTYQDKATQRRLEAKTTEDADLAKSNAEAKKLAKKANAAAPDTVTGGDTDEQKLVGTVTKAQARKGMPTTKPVEPTHEAEVEELPLLHPNQKWSSITDKKVQGALVVSNRKHFRATNPGGDFGKSDAYNDPEKYAAYAAKNPASAAPASSNDAERALNEASQARLVAKLAAKRKSEGTDQPEKKERIKLGGSIAAGTGRKTPEEMPAFHMNQAAEYAKSGNQDMQMWHLQKAMEAKDALKQGSDTRGGHFAAGSGEGR